MTPHTPLLCPRCQQALFAGETRGNTIHGCGQCGGVWLDRNTSAKVIDSACQATIQLSQQAAQNRQREVDDGGQHQLKCPVCQQTMRTQRRANAWLDVDECEHGVWYDSGELERVARAAKRGPGADWRTQNNHGKAFAVAAAAGGTAAVGTAAVAGVQHGLIGDVAENMAAGAASSTVGDVALEFAGDAAAEIAFEGLFALIGSFFD